MCRVHLVVFAALIATGSAPGCCAPDHGAVFGTVSGVVRDSAGVPQMGASVQLLRPDLTVIASVFTNVNGRFSIPSVAPGRYALKAMGASFLPSLRENLRVRSSAVVNLTLHTLYEAMQWLPAQPRAGNAQTDDWVYTLRSAANRPLLRWLEDGPLVVVSDGPGSVPKLKARLMATGQEGTFGESGERFSATLDETPSNSRELLARVDFAPDTDAGMESMLGFRQDLGYAGAVQSVAAIAIHPEIEAGGAEGLDEAAFRTWETMHLGDEIEAEAGSTQVLTRFDRQSPHTVTAALPSAAVSRRAGNTAIHYRMATAIPAVQEDDADRSEADAWLPAISTRNGDLALEHGLHQEIGWERRTADSGMSVLLYASRIDNPVIEAMGHFANGESDGDLSASAVLFDRASGLLRLAGPDYSSAGMMAAVERRLPGGNLVRIAYADGDSLVMPVLTSSAQTAGLVQMLAGAHPRRVQTYSISLSGTLDGTRTRWRASYRWQPEDTVTPVCPFGQNAAEPYLNLHIRQPLYASRDGLSGLEALLDVRNLLAEGYRPYLTGDGSLLVFAQEQRGIQGGLAFTF